jgi:hypothetical protein
MPANDDKASPQSSFGEDDSFQRRHDKSLKSTADELQKMETGGGVSAKEEKTKKHHTDDSSELPNAIQGGHNGQLASLLFVMALLIVGITSIILLSPSLLLVNVKENLVNDLNDGTKAYFDYSNKVLDMTSGGGGCDYKSDPTIKCKFETMSTYMRQNFSKHGFTISPQEPPDPSDSPLGELYPPPPDDNQEPPERKGTSVTKDTYGHSISGKLSEAAAKDSTLREMLYKVYSPRTSLFQDRKFDKRLYDKFNITRETAVGGRTKEEVYESFDKQIDSSGDKIDVNGQGNYGADKLANSAEEWKKIMDNLIRDKNGFKVASIASLACAYDTYERLAENAIVNARAVTVARYAMNFLTAADAVKAGKSDEMTSMTLSGMLIKDSDAESNATDASSYRTPAMFESVQGSIDINNPQNLLAMLTVPGSMMGTLKERMLETFAKGIGLSSPAAPPGDGIYNPKSNDPYGWCTAAQSDPEKFNNEVKFVPGNPPSWYCNVHPQSLATILGYGLLGVELSIEPVYYIAPTLAVACATLEELPTKLVSTTLTPLVQGFAEMTFSPARNMTKTTGIPYAEQNPSSKDVQDAIFAGTGILLGDMAQSRGLKPVTESDTGNFSNYLKEASLIEQQYESDKRELARAEPFNVYNPYSFVGSIAQTTLGGQYAATNVIDATMRLTGIFGAALTNVASILSPSTSAMFSQPLADSFDASRLSKCGFNDNRRFWGRDGIKIKADFGCNIRHYMPQSALNKDINSVIEYMTKDEQPKDVDWAQKTVDQLNERSAVGRDAPRLAKLKSEAQEGASGSFVDKKTGEPKPHTQYAKFLQYCVNRKDPWGGYALAVEPAEDTYKPNPQYVYGKDSYAAEEEQARRAGTGETPDSYYAIASGPLVDQDWYTGVNCLKDNAMIDNFRAYTLACSVLASMSGSRECWQEDEVPHDLPDDFYLSNDVLFLSNLSVTIGPAEEEAN